VVLDPLLGSGTTAVVALEMGATVIGYDIDENAIAAGADGKALGQPAQA
jgi:DNA modification methylase